MEAIIEIRICKDCKNSYPLSDYPSAGIKNGIRYKRLNCRECYQKVKRKYDKGKISWLESYKKTCRCNRCSVDDYRVLEFHHLGNKEFNIGDAVNRGYSREKILAEIDKCEVLCANCHRIETYEKRQDNEFKLSG